MNQLSEMELGLRPRLLAGGWFAVTACVPIIGFFAVLGRSFFVGPTAFEPVIGIIFIAIPILMAAFFGFVFGSRILNDGIVNTGRNAVGHGIFVGVLSYVGFVIAYGAGQITNATRPVGDILESILSVAGIGAILVGWLIVIAGGLSGWLLFRYSYFYVDAPAATWTDKRSAVRLNYGAAAVLVFVLFLCWLPIHFRMQREATEESQRDLIHAVWSNDPDRVREFLDSGLSVETKDVGGTPLLMTAAEKGHTRIVKILLERGANPNIRSDHFGRSPLHWACANFDVESIKMLVSKSANLNAGDDYGNTPLMVAASTTDRDTVKFLIENGANPKAVSRDGSTPLSLAKRDRDTAGNRDRMNETTLSSLDAGQNFGDARDYQNPAIVKRARDRHDAIVELLKSYALK